VAFGNIALKTALTVKNAVFKEKKRQTGKA